MSHGVVVALAAVLMIYHLMHVLNDIQLQKSGFQWK
jgi:hypothetical protein